MEERTTVISPNKAGDIASPAVLVHEFKDVEEAPKGSPSKAGDIIESNAFHEWKENKKAHLETLNEEDKFPIVAVAVAEDIPIRKRRKQVWLLKSKNLKAVIEAAFHQEEPVVTPFVQNNEPEIER